MKANYILIATICCIVFSLESNGQVSTDLNNKATLQYTGETSAKVEAKLNKGFIPTIQLFSHTIHLRKTILR